MDEWGNCLYDIGMRQADDAAVYFHLKHVQDLQKLKEWEKVRLMNCSIEVLDELACECVVELHSVEEHDGCFSTHYLYLRLD